MNSLEENSNPVPQGNYVPATRFGNFIITSGMTPRKNGVLIQSGKIHVNEAIYSYKAVVRQAVANALTATENLLEEQERLEQIVSLTVYINAEESFQEHSGLANFASEYLQEKLGEVGIGSRAAIGVSSLPSNAPIEIQMIAATR